jgi:MFS transporter, FHS family, glucose/mannose:H+ symporter
LGKIAHAANADARELVTFRPEATGGPERPFATHIAYGIFAACGLGVVLPGTLLPQLLVRWALNDQQAGILFFLFFVGSSGGSVLARGPLSRSIAMGCAAICAGNIALGISARAWSFAAITVLGLGLGLTMTSVSLLQSRRRAETRIAEMSRLNLIWAVGACLAPAVLLRGSTHWSLQSILNAIACCFAFFCILAAFFIPDAKMPAPLPGAPSSQTKHSVVPLLLLAIVPLATGVESSAGGWLAAYSERSGLLLLGTVSTVSCFWLGLLLSRFVQSYRSVAGASKNIVLRVGPWVAAVALLLIIFQHQGLVMAVGAFGLGLGIGPIYPLVLSLLLDRGEAGNSAFLAGGVGASTLPLLTGVVSGYFGSLSAGLLIPMLGATAMGMLALMVKRNPST